MLLTTVQPKLALTPAGQRVSPISGPFPSRTIDNVAKQLITVVKPRAKILPIPALLIRLPECYGLRIDPSSPGTLALHPTIPSSRRFISSSCGQRIQDCLCNQQGQSTSSAVGYAKRGGIYTPRRVAERSCLITDGRFRRASPAINTRNGTPPRRPNRLWEYDPTAAVFLARRNRHRY